MAHDNRALPVTRPAFGDEELRLVRQCLDSGWVTQGAVTRRFEELVAQLHRVRHAVACSNCTAALHISLLALDIRPGDEVVVPSFTWVTSAHAVEYVGGRPIFCDIDPLTFNVDVRSMEASLTPRTKAVMAVHLFGLAADMEPIRNLAARRGLSVIEDAACAIGSRYRSRPVGSLGTLACFSFHPRKIVTTGEGGIVTTMDDELALRLRRLRNHGASPAVAPVKPFDMGPFDHLGFNYRLSDIQAAVGVAQMARLEGLIAERRALARRYDELLAKISWLQPPLEPEGYFHTYQSYVVWVAETAPVPRDEVMLGLERQDIQTRPGTLAVHATGFYRRKYGIPPEAFPVSLAAERRSMTLPLFPGMTAADQDRVVAGLRELGG